MDTLLYQLRYLEGIGDYINNLSQASIYLFYVGLGLLATAGILKGVREADEESRELKPSQLERSVLRNLVLRPKNH